MILNNISKKTNSELNLILEYEKMRLEDLYYLKKINMINDLRIRIDLDFRHCQANIREIENELQKIKKQQIIKYGITTKNGLLYIKDRQINLPEADALAIKFGFFYAERLVEFLEKNKYKGE
jgi:hypothetical protein